MCLYFFIIPIVYCVYYNIGISALFLQVNCRGYNAFGRRKRDIDAQNNTDMAINGDLLSGQMREEITIQSNAILTFERREERLMDPAEGRKHFLRSLV